VCPCQLAASPGTMPSAAASASADLAPPGGTAADLVSPCGTAADLATPGGTTTDSAPPGGTAADSASADVASTQGITAADVALPGGTPADVAPAPGGIPADVAPPPGVLGVGSAQKRRCRVRTLTRRSSCGKQMNKVLGHSGLIMGFGAPKSSFGSGRPILKANNS
jgi:hypothetical protein